MQPGGRSTAGVISRSRITRFGALVAAALSASLVAPAPAATAEDSATVEQFRPQVASLPQYDVARPPAECQAGGPTPCDQKQFVMTTQQGMQRRIYVEISLPKQRPGGPAVPRALPTVLIMSPYATFDLPAGAMRFNEITNHFVERGYAVAIGHLLGTGLSEGCSDQGGPDEIEATARVIDYLGRRAGSNGRVGMVGISYAGTPSIGAAALGDRHLVEPLKAIVPVGAVSSWYDFYAFDGVSSGTGLVSKGADSAVSLLPGLGATPTSVERPGCTPKHLAAGAELDLTGNFSPYWLERDYRRAADRITAATLLVHGLDDPFVYPSASLGWLDRLPSTTPRKALLGQWAHEWPDKKSERLPQSTGVDTGRRTDWFATVQSWFDRYLLDADTGVEKWPAVQVQSTDQLWRAETQWPPSGRPGQLALGPSPTLGATEPTGQVSFNEATGKVEFTTAALADDLRMTGQPVLDLWLEVDGNPRDAHVAVTLEVLTPQAAGLSTSEQQSYGARSVQHLDPIVHGRFTDDTPTPPPAGRFRVPVRLSPVDLVAPVGSQLRVTVAGHLATMPSGSNSRITVLHDCAHPSILRFVLPDEKVTLLDVERLDGEPVSTSLPKRFTSDGGGAATSKVCGQEAVHPASVL